MREKYSGAPNFSATGYQRGREDLQGDDPQRPGDERPKGGDPESRAGPALPGHLVAVEAGDDRGGLARDVDQDGGGGAAVISPVVDAGQHDNGGGGGDPERHR